MWEEVDMMDSVRVIVCMRNDLNIFLMAIRPSCLFRLFSTSSPFLIPAAACIPVALRTRGGTAAGRASLRASRRENDWSGCGGPVRE